jgi:hypothetical protein
MTAIWKRRLAASSGDRLSCRGAGTRTRDLSVPNAARYQAALHPARNVARSSVAFALVVKSDIAVDIPIVPKDALFRISAGINRRPKRLLGVLKVENEYVGYVHADRFEIWERRQRAVHAVGTVQPRVGGSHIEVRFVLPMRTRVLIVVFFALYAAVAAGLTLGSSNDAALVQKLLVAALGALALVIIFVAAAIRQTSDLRGFVERLFGEVPRI